MLSPDEIGKIGEGIVATHLRKVGFQQIITNTKLPGSTDIEATKSILVQVKTSMQPNEPAFPSLDEIRNIKSRATKLGRTAGVAQVLIDENEQLVGKIKFTTL